MEEYAGPYEPPVHSSMHANGFTDYDHSRGKSLEDNVHSIAARIAEAKRVKGALSLNNGKPNGGTWKTPKLDEALKSKSGFKGGETG